MELNIKRVTIFSKILKSLLVITLVFVSYLLADDYKDVVYLKDGSIVKGIIVENIINKSIKVQTIGGSLINYDYKNIEKFGKEKIEGEKVEGLRQPPQSIETSQGTKVNENFTTSKFSTFNIGLGIGMLQNHFGVFLDLTSPYFFADSLAFSLYGGGYLVDSKAYRNLDEEGRLEQLFGNFRFSFIFSDSGSNFRAYIKTGPSMAIVRDKTWKNYSRAILKQTLEEKDNHDFLFGMHGIIGAEWFIVSDRIPQTVFVELGWEMFFNGYISPNSYALSELISEFVDQDAVEFNFVISIGARIFSP